MRKRELRVKKKLLFLIVIALYSCASRPKAMGPAAPPPVDSRLAAAEALFARGCYVPLKQAFGIYSELYAHPEMKKAVASRLATTSLLLAVREKELGIADTDFMDRALELIRVNPSLGNLKLHAEVAGHFLVQGRGVVRDIDVRFPWKETEERLKKAEAELSRRAALDEFSAYMYAVLKCSGANPYEEREELATLWGSFPDSTLLKFKRATCPRPDPVRLKELIAADPQFYEAEYFLGDQALENGHLLEAEAHFLAAWAGIPESPQIAISLASIYFATEELELSLDFYEKTLAIAPEYRDALLGKAICLSYLGLRQEAMAVCEKIIGLGYWLLGESYYWLAWNQHELKDDAAAAENVEQAKGRLPTSTEVFTLSGAIALERGDLVKAEKDLKEAIQFHPANSEALMLLGSLSARKKDWPNSAAFFERAGSIYEETAAELQAKIDDLKKSTLAEERKNALLRRKARQLEITRLSMATAFYDAGAGYFNCGQRQKALGMALRAAEHPAFKQKAEELASQIK